MKTYLVVGILLLGMSGQAMSMGHPHNLFAARKMIRTKASVSIVKSKTKVSVCWQSAADANQSNLGTRLLNTLTSVCRTQLKLL